MSKLRSFKPKQFQRQEAQVQNPGVNTSMAFKDHLQPKTNSLKLIPLGGVGVVQKNMFVYEYGEDIVIVDCGIGFPDEGMPGVDLVLPDITYLKDKKHKIRAIIISHGHDDHIGGLPYLWPELNVPIYSQKLTCGLIKTKFVEHKLPLDPVKTLGIKDELKLGSFNVSFYQVSHSIPDSTGIVLSTPAGTIIHQADFKIDWTPVNGQVSDVAKAARVGDVGVRLLTIDCLRVEKQGYTLSEKTIEPTFDKLEQETKGKLLITLMTSNVTRIQQAINVALKSGRKVAISGRSMENTVQVARDLGYLDIPPNLIIAQEEIKRFNDEKLMILISGSLGQEGSALDRVANKDHKYIRVRKGDTVVFSSDPMPSAEVSQGQLINSLTKLGCNVYASTLMEDLHVSGHAAAEELKLMLGLIRPQYVMPMGGEHRHMVAFAKMAQDLGFREDQILLPHEGDVIEIDAQKARIIDGFDTQNIFVDGLGVGDIGGVVLRDRQIMSEEGIVVVIVPLDQHGRLTSEPDVISKGFVFEKAAEDLLDAAREIVKRCLTEKTEGIQDWKYARHEIERSLEKFFYSQLKRTPIILPIVVEV